MISSPGSSRVSRIGWPASAASRWVRWNSRIGIVRGPAGPSTSARAFSMARATAGSDGCTATQSCVQPKMAWRSCRPASDVQPLPGSRLLQGHGSGSSARKYGQRVRCSTFPPIVARFRSWAEAACRQAEASAPAA